MKSLIPIFFFCGFTVEKKYEPTKTPSLSISKEENVLNYRKTNPEESKRIFKEKLTARENLDVMKYLKKEELS